MPEFYQNYPYYDPGCFNSLSQAVLNALSLSDAQKAHLYIPVTCILQDILGRHV